MTLINMFTVEPANQRRLVELLTEATEVSGRRALFLPASIAALTGRRSRCMHNGGASMIIRRCVRILPRFRFFRKRSRSPSLNPASTKSCEPSHPPASRIEATTVLSALHRQKRSFHIAHSANEPRQVTMLRQYSVLRSIGCRTTSRSRTGAASYNVVENTDLTMSQQKPDGLVSLCALDKRMLI